MPQHRQPSSLLALCHAQVASDLVSMCRLLQIAAQDSSAAHVLALVKRRLRPRYQSQLPGAIRSQLMEEASRLFAAPAPDGSNIGAGPAPLYLLALLLAPDIHHLKVELCCYYGCSHQAALLRLLATEGRGLETLELARPALLRLDRALLHTALVSAVFLRHLALRNIAGDGVLQVIGAACPKLETLDVAHSRQVTDSGLRYLFLQVELRDKTQKNLCSVPKESSRQVEPSDPGCSGWSRLRILLRLVPWLRYQRGDGKKDRILLEYFERRNSLCDTLRVLNVANTGITSTGILLILHHVPNLESLGEYGNTGRALEILDRALSNAEDGAIISSSNFNLTYAHSCRTTLRRLELLASACPHLQNLTVSEPHHLPSALTCLSSLTSLHLHCIPPDSQWVQDLCTYLSIQGTKLHNLTLRFALKEFIALLDLSKIIRCCPNLRMLISDNAAIHWGDKVDAKSSIPPLKHLQCVQLGRATMAQAVVQLLSRAPKLVTAHFHSCPDLCDDHLVQLTQGPIDTNGKSWSKDSSTSLSSNLECFYIYEAPLLTATAVATLLASCDQLGRIGNMNKWGLDCEGLHWIHNLALGNNLQLELYAGSHWFCSRCVPMV